MTLACCYECSGWSLGTLDPKHASLDVHLASFDTFLGFSLVLDVVT